MTTFMTVEQLQTEIERLRAFVETAYADGFTDAWGVYDNELSRIEELNWHWEHSDTRAALQPKEGKK